MLLNNVLELGERNLGNAQNFLHPGSNLLVGVSSPSEVTLVINHAALLLSKLTHVELGIEQRCALVRATDEKT